MPRWNSKSADQKKDWIRAFTYPVMATIGFLIFLFLTYHSLFYTQYMAITWEEKPLNAKDHPLWNVAALVVFAAVMLGIRFLGKRLSEKWQGRLEILGITFATLWIFVLGLLWITAIDRVPQGDQAVIYGGASYFMEGKYHFLGHGGNCQIYPQQLGQIAVVELFFHVVGPYNYFAIEVACVFFAAGIVLRGLKAGFTVKMTYCLLMMGCIPLVCYTSWVYGDVPSTFFLFLAFFFILCLREKPKWYIEAGVVCSFVMACLTRKNSMIFLVAFVILALIDAVSKRRWRMLLSAILCLMASLLCYQGVYAAYEYRSGIKVGRGLPVNSWIVMGMQESWNGNGWYNNFPKDEAMALDWDFDAVETVMSDYLRERMGEFRDNPGYARQFFKQKVLSQWNEPFFQCMWFSSNFQEEKGPATGSFLYRVYHTWQSFFDVLFWADRWHFLIFLGMLLYFAGAVKRDREPMDHLFAVTIIGGFFFTILWEAKARYVLPYFLMAFPLAVMGYAGFAEWVCAAWKKRRGQARPAQESEAGDASTMERSKS